MSPQKTVAASASVFRAFFLCCLVVFLSFIVFFVVCCVSFGSFYAHVFAAPGFFFFFLVSQDLEDDAEYADIKTDVAEECGQYGKIK